MKRRAAIVIPTLNEGECIGGLLQQFGRSMPDIVAEILVVDGGSTDATCDLVREAAGRDGRIRLVHNLARRQGPGINLAVAQASRSADTIVRVDAHARYPDNYVEQIMSVFFETGADMIAVRLVTVGQTCLQRGIAAASNSVAGTGGSAHRVGGRSGWVDHGHHAGMDRRLFELAGGYDETFDANEDAELDVRIRALGGRVWLAGDIEIDYFPRRTFAALFQQYFRYGMGRARTFLKHRERLRLRQVVAPAIVLGLAASLVGGLFSAWLLLPAALYALSITVVTLLMFSQARRLCALSAAPALVTMHVAWGLGFLQTIGSVRDRSVEKLSFRRGIAS